MLIGSCAARRWLLAALVGAAEVGGAAPARPARADDAAPFTLGWDAPAGCPSAAEVEAATRTLLGDARIAPENRVEARAVVTRGPSSWSVELATRRGKARGSRRIDAPTCRELADAVAITLALTLQPEKGGLPPVIEPPPPVIERPPPSSPIVAVAPPPAAVREARPHPPAPASTNLPAPARSPAPSRARPAANAFTVGAGFVGDAGLLPAIAFGPAVSLGWLHAPFRVDLTGTFLPPSVAPIESIGGGVAGQAPSGSVDARYLMVSGGLRGCYLVTTVVEVGPCAGAELGWIHAARAGRGSETEPWATFSLGAMLGLRLYRGLAIRMPALVEIGTRPILPAGTSSTYRPAAATGRLELGLEYRFF